MAEIITAVYENGMLRPLQPLKLRERQTVRLQVLGEESVDPIEAALQELADAGVLTRPSAHSEMVAPTKEERRALAEALAQAPGKPLSEMIIEDRGEL